MFAELGRPDLSARWVSWVRKNRYDATPAGLPGNDDGGTLSSWYVFAALGLYPKHGDTRYVLAAPLFPKATVHLGAGRTLVIRAEGPIDGSTHVAEIRWNGVPLDAPFIEHAALSAGGELIYVML
jgi:putative alpha-1,2-mannosidase